jgi:hypothetical protein
MVRPGRVQLLEICYEAWRIAINIAKLANLSRSQSERRAGTAMSELPDPVTEAAKELVKQLPR